jgi:hypothetical protein
LVITGFYRLLGFFASSLLRFPPNAAAAYGKKATMNKRDEIKPKETDPLGYPPRLHLRFRLQIAVQPRQFMTEQGRKDAPNRLVSGF